MYFERAELERLRGYREQPPRIFEIYRRKLADDADEVAGVVASPPPEIELASSSRSSTQEAAKRVRATDLLRSASSYQLMSLAETLT